ncbi:TPA: hypothetical protein U0J94_000171 [Streptococcus suis]|uniref:Uncharacterized protein n=1 Tax=Streptococcus suis TaxID=1307 RepID=A0AAP6DW73_STRSU|nr:hypothetical protein [Streptococcus suis]AGF87325.1 hypothetical protein phi20c_0035 [Streptococcus phage phi20c]QBX21044.1 hypothetical protein Javan551_0019 [Streptococcus phage Javan551]MCB2907163.1 hypothetical protein [Streptococcus suis]MCO0824753.1 hypothetical protein [Streptococcus suis]MCO0826792.1 hypothetical protein [Streptococcus suis]
MGYTELGRKRPIVIQGDTYDEILIYKYKGEVWGVCYKGGEIDAVYNYTKKDFYWSIIFGMTLKEIIKKVIQPLKRSYPGDYSMIDEHLVRKALKVDKL